MVSIVWTHIAREDLKSIYDFIAKESFKYADREVDKIQKVVLKLKTQPKLGKIVLEKRNYKLRELVSGNYRIVYEITEDNKIEIILIHHGARDLKRRL